jgi:phage gp36-like protein
MASHASVDDLLKRYDLRRIGDLVNDNDTRASEVDLKGNTTAGAVTQTALSDASGMINSAILAGKRYKLSDLLSMTDESKALLKRLCCDLAYALLIARRGYGGEDMVAMTSRAKESEQILEQLRQGDRLFEIEANQNASVPNQAVISKNISLFSNELDRFFGMRVSNINENFNNRG